MKMTISKEWVGKMASLEADLPIGVGSLDMETKAMPSADLLPLSPHPLAGAVPHTPATPD